MRDIDEVWPETDRTKWLNGWPAKGRWAFIHGSIYCVGCGADWGPVGHTPDPNFKAPEKLPDWPFDEDNCPVCLGNVGV